MHPIDHDDAVFQFDLSQSESIDDAHRPTDKGKGPSLAVPIPSAALFDDHYDDFGLSSNVDLSSFSSSVASTSTMSYGSFQSTSEPMTPSDAINSLSTQESQGPTKGKERELPPSLPPFAFDPGSSSSSWPLSTHIASAAHSTSLSQPPSSLGQPLIISADPITLQRARSRRRSFSASSSTTIDSSPNPASSDFPIDDSNSQRDAPSLDQHISFPLNEEHTSFTSSLLNLQPIVSPKVKGRSQSCPYPFSALDLVNQSQSNLHQPLIFLRTTAFQDKLPRELQLHILRCLVTIHEQDHLRNRSDPGWTLAKASKVKWVGRDRAVRELVKFSRVSKCWLSLVFDGQLWTDINLHAFPSFPQSLILRVTTKCGTSLNLAGHASLSPASLTSITDSLCLHCDTPHTQLTHLNLRGCSSITTRPLHGLLMCSPLLTDLCLKGLTVVTNSTCDILSSYCPRLVSLDVSRCPNMDAMGIKSWAKSAMQRQEHLCLKVLRLSGLRFIDDDTMFALGRAAPHLETLDLSYARQLHNSALEAFVACNDAEDEQSLGVPTIILNARQAGRESNDPGTYKRRRTRLRHLCLSSCTLLTDTACSNLAHCMPNLETLELAGIGEDLKDDGLVHLLNTTPMIRCLDLEDASDITDAVLATITPLEASSNDGETQSEPGSSLEHLVISYATNLTDNALLTLVRRCTRLRVLEADNTHMGASVLKEFVRLSRKRAISNAKIVAVDCRGINEPAVKELWGMTRPRLGWRSYSARRLKFLDGRDGDLEDLKMGGQDECDDKRVVLKSFYSWQSVDTVIAAREKRQKSSTKRKAASESSESNSSGTISPRRWWTPGRRGGTGTPPLHNDEGCRIM